MAQVNVRNLEQIQEHDSARPSRIGTLLLVSLAGAAVVSGFVMMSKKNGAPARALYLQLAATAAYLLSGRGDALVSSVSFVEWIFHGLAALALLSLRRVRPELPRPFRSPQPGRRPASG